MLESESILAFCKVVEPSGYAAVRPGGGAEELMASPEVLPVLKKLNLIEMPAAFGDYLRTGPRCHKKQGNENNIKSFHNGPFCDGE